MLKEVVIGLRLLDDMFYQNYQTLYLAFGKVNRTLKLFQKVDNIQALVLVSILLLNLLQRRSLFALNFQKLRSQTILRQRVQNLRVVRNA